MYLLDTVHQRRNLYTDTNPTEHNTIDQSIISQDDSSHNRYLSSNLNEDLTFQKLLPYIWTWYDYGNPKKIPLKLQVISLCLVV